MCLPVLHSAPGGNITLTGNGNANSYEGTLQIGPEQPLQLPAPRHILWLVDL